MKDGHAIGNHTQNHIRGWKTKAKDYLNNIGEAQEAIHFQILQSKFQDFKIANLFRPPYGQITPKQGKKTHEIGLQNNYVGCFIFLIGTILLKRKIV